MDESGVASAMTSVPHFDLDTLERDNAESVRIGLSAAI
jgi:hypothetical protein